MNLEDWYSDDATRRGLAMTQMFSASLSFLASSCIVVIIWRCPTGLSSPYKRIIFALSLSDTLQSLALATGPFAVPRDAFQAVPGFGSGSMQSCEANGCAMIIGAAAVPMYTCLLVYYYYCKLCLSFTDGTFLFRVERNAHIIIVLWNLGAGLGGIITENINASPLGYTCTFSNTPVGCVAFSDIVGPCERGKHSAIYVIVFLFLVPFLSFVAVLLITVLVFSHAIKKGRINRRRRHRRRQTPPPPPRCSSENGNNKNGKEYDNDNDNEHKNNDNKHENVAVPNNNNNNNHKKADPLISFEEVVDDYRSSESSGNNNHEQQQQRDQNNNNHSCSHACGGDQNKTFKLILIVGGERKTVAVAEEEEETTMSEEPSSKRSPDDDDGDDDESLRDAAHEEAVAFQIYKREIMLQAILYAASFILVYSNLFLQYFLVFAHIRNPLFMRFLLRLFYPLGGFFNIMIWARPKVVRLRQRYPSHSSIYALYLVLKAGGN